MNAFKTLTTGLFYPAIVGTVFVQVVLHVTHYESAAEIVGDLAVWHGLVLLVFFSACFVRTHEVADDKYSAETFALDAAEVGCIFLAFLSLRLFDTSLPIVKTPNYLALYLLLALTVGIQWSWSRFTHVGSPSRKLTAVRVALIVGFVIAAIASTSTPRVPWLHEFFLGFLAFNVGAYIYSTRK